MGLLNVRIGDEDARLVRSLREHGISISDVVRGAIRTEAQRIRSAEAPDPGALLAEMRDRYPTPPTATAAHRVNSAERRQVQALVRERLRRRA
jgi:Arc/MetJ-type ribon-helix-helix transcriptional regulator